MANESESPLPFSLRRWSQRKREAARDAAVPRDAVGSAPAAPVAVASGERSAPAPAAPSIPASLPAAMPGSPPVAGTPTPATTAELPLPPVDTLTIDSDFTPFMQPKVAEDVKRAALKKLFSDPQFNVMDGLDIYIGDYTQPDPMPGDMLEKLGKVYGMLANADEPPVATAAESGTTSVPVAPVASKVVPVDDSPEAAVPSLVPAEGNSSESAPAAPTVQGRETPPR